MKLTERLIEEHNEIRRILRVVSVLAQDLKNHKTFYANDVDILSNYFQIFWDKCHCTKEEHVLFPALIKEGLITESESIGLIIQEHKFGRKYLNDINRSVEKLKLGYFFSVDELCGLLLNYSEMLMKHMKKEEEYYFTLADRVISSDKQQILLNECNLIDDGLMKQSNYMMYKEKFRALEVKYSSKMNLNV